MPLDIKIGDEKMLYDIHRKQYKYFSTDRTKLPVTQ